MTNDEIKKALLAGNYITEDDYVNAVNAIGKNAPITDYLLNEGIITLSILGQATAEFYGVPYTNLDAYPVSKSNIAKIPETTARKFNVVLVSEDKSKIVIATNNPTQTDLIPTIQALFPGKKIDTTYALSDAIAAHFIAYQKPLETRFSKIIKENTRVAPEIIDEIIGDAITLNASDIHFEPVAEEVIIRFRIDGVIQEAGRIKKIFYENILNRIKVQAKLRIDEHFSAQDGSIRYTQKDGKFTDMRISVIPTIDGEKVVMRLLGEYVRGLTMGDLGLSRDDEEIIEAAARKPFGMILVTGPTGSGKSTTLYALIRSLNNPRVNITTIEDPVEYRITGVNQVQVNAATNLTFAKGLRSIVRQDPDIVLVGEIRDTETAEIAVNAALTGHLMLSTFHANDAATAVPRLLNMGIEPFLLASTLELIVAQRLVRRICMHCRHSIAVPQAELEKKFKQADVFFSEKTVTLYEGKGCDTCNHTGFIGRIGIFEFITVTPEVKSLILSNPASNQVWELARKNGARSMFEDGIDKVKNGTTTIDELLRVAEPSEDAALVLSAGSYKK